MHGDGTPREQCFFDIMPNHKGSDKSLENISQYQNDHPDGKIITYTEEGYESRDSSGKYNPDVGFGRDRISVQYWTGGKDDYHFTSSMFMPGYGCVFVSKHDESRALIFKGFDRMRDFLTRSVEDIKIIAFPEDYIDMKLNGHFSNSQEVAADIAKYSKPAYTFKFAYGYKPQRSLI